MEGRCNSNTYVSRRIGPKRIRYGTPCVVVACVVAGLCLECISQMALVVYVGRSSRELSLFSLSGQRVSLWVFRASAAPCRRSLSCPDHHTFLVSSRTCTSTFCFVSFCFCSFCVVHSAPYSFGRNRSLEGATRLVSSRFPPGTCRELLC